MDPSFYSPQTKPSKAHHHHAHAHHAGHHASPSAAAVCYCRVHGTMTAANYFSDPYNAPPSPVTRQLMQQHPEAVVIQTAGKPTQIVPCQVGLKRFILIS